MNTTFADTIINITVTGTLVRIDLGTLVPISSADGKQEIRATITQQIVMPLDGFTRAFGAQESVIKRLIADGIIKPKEQPIETATIGSWTT